jgi:hypothetical protein
MGCVQFGMAKVYSVVGSVNSNSTFLMDDMEGKNECSVFMRNVVKVHRFKNLDFLQSTVN